jgi:hypothetical protein
LAGQPDFSTEFAEVLARVRSWSPDLRLGLAEAILSSLHPLNRADQPRGVPAEMVRGIAAGRGPTPDDQTVRQWIEEHRQEKYE